ncbi:MAG: restriction endonuclease subunit R [Gammaproteobacteria bacterium]|nr:restriction endonuclease subunit R [Gammaproteobacteria bacterium]MYG97446.1 restriction endonuclease subunit R [Gammaproteobacteria bacterium]
MELKRYQSETLGVLRRFLEEARIGGPENAYEAVTQEPEQVGRLGALRGDYQPLAGLQNVPYVCLRLPTGGGKTILAAHAVAIARDAWIEKDWPMVLWLTPTNTIRSQTAEALKNHRHAYRRVLDEAFDGRVRVFDIADFAHIRPHDIHENCCIVVGTIQTLRVTNTEGRKVYAHNEDMESHFTGLTAPSSELETLENGNPKFSFANLMHLHRPMMIVDEAHNAVTGLTREMQSRVNPCAIVEFTATPRPNSNILHSVTAGELKAEDMIKLPVILSEYETWQNAVNGAVAMRNSLAEVAEDDPDFIRPIVLFQAQKKNGKVPVAVLKRHLVEVERIPEDRIAVATGDQRGLDGIDLFDPACPIEHVITVEALKEGWDCSFAYAFCSVSQIRSAVNVEQLLGRVLRMPYAQRRTADSLNRAYAFLSEPSFGEAAKSLVDKLVTMGFDEEEARESVRPAQDQLNFDDDLFREDDEVESHFTYTIPARQKLISDLKRCEGATVLETADGYAKIAVAGEIDKGVEGEIFESLPPAERERFVAAVSSHRAESRKMLPPARRGEKFLVPRLMVAVQGSLEFADAGALMEYSDWSLGDHPWRPGADEFAIRETAHTFEIDLDGARVAYQFTKEEQQFALDVDVEGWTPEVLVLWLDREVRQPDIGQSDLVGWLSQVVNHLVVSRSLHITALMRCKFILARKVREKISAIRQKVREGVYEQHLFAPGAKPEVSFDHAFAFKDGMYLNQRRYRGNWKPGRHFLGPRNVPAFDGAEDGEEFHCAQVIDSLPKVKYWIRNVAKHDASFWLPTSSGKFYPDFVAMLEDGRLLVVEYKGAHIAEGSDTAEKRAIGELWERKSNGRGVFVLAEKSAVGRDTRTQIMEKIGACIQ